MILKKNTAKSKGMTYGKHELDAVRKFSYEAWLFLAKPLNILHLCMGEDIHKINTNWILLTGSGLDNNKDNNFITLVPTLELYVGFCIKLDKIVAKMCHR
jgi:hypothetical protein